MLHASLLATTSLYRRAKNSALTYSASPLARTTTTHDHGRLSQIGMPKYELAGLLLVASRCDSINSGGPSIVMQLVESTLATLEYGNEGLLAWLGYPFPLGAR